MTRRRIRRKELGEFPTQQDSSHHSAHSVVFIGLPLPLHSLALPPLRPPAQRPQPQAALFLTPAALPAALLPRFLAPGVGASSPARSRLLVFFHPRHCRRRPATFCGRSTPLATPYPRSHPAARGTSPSAPAGSSLKCGYGWHRGSGAGPSTNRSSSSACSGPSPLKTRTAEPPGHIQISEYY
jgi:hypothetical protein